jgi:hypothetical protein
MLPAANVPKLLHCNMLVIINMRTIEPDMWRNTDEFTELNYGNWYEMAPFDARTLFPSSECIPFLLLQFAFRDHSIH